MDQMMSSGKRNQESNVELEETKQLKALARCAASSVAKSADIFSSAKESDLPRKEVRDEIKRKRGRPTASQYGKSSINREAQALVFTDASSIPKQDTQDIIDPIIVTGAWNLDTQTSKRGKQNSTGKPNSSNETEDQKPALEQANRNGRESRRPFSVKQHTTNARESERVLWTAGKLIRYAFQTETQEWLWYTGVVQAAWRKNSWFRVMFEDGEQMWVRCDKESKGRMWQEIEPRNVASEKLRFENNLNLASPGAFSKLKFNVDGGCSSTSDKGAVPATRQASRRHQRDDTNLSSIIPRRLKSVPHR